MVRHLKIALTLTVVTLLMYNCGRSPFAEEPDKVAQVGDKILTADEIRSLTPQGLSSEDSLKMVESYIDVWVKTQLKVHEAEKMAELNLRDIDSLVNQYRSSLLSNKFEQHYIDSKLDTVFTDEAVLAYYDEHKTDFVLDRAIVKGRIVRVPESFRQKRQIRDLVEGSGEKLLDLKSMVEKNRLELNEFDKWVDFGEFLSYIPVSKNRSYDDMLTKKGIQEMTDGTDVYYIVITETLAQGEVAPLERVSEMIKRILYNNRRQQILRSYEDSIYQAGMDNDIIKIYNR